MNKKKKQCLQTHCRVTKTNAQTSGKAMSYETTNGKHKNSVKDLKINDTCPQSINDK